MVVSREEEDARFFFCFFCFLFLFFGVFFFFRNCGEYNALYPGLSNKCYRPLKLVVITGFQN